MGTVAAGLDQIATILLCGVATAVRLVDDVRAPA
jgi:hypothetical protein